MVAKTLRSEMSLWLNLLYKNELRWERGLWVGGDLSIRKECEEILVFDSIRTLKLLANLSNQDHIVGVKHSVNLRILSRPGKRGVLTSGTHFPLEQK